MIKVEIDKKKIVVCGHADYDDYGKDIVCASASSIITVSINAILRIANDSISYEDNKKQLVINILKDNDLTNKLLENMISMLEELAKTYPKNIKIKKGY